VKDLRRRCVPLAHEMVAGYKFYGLRGNIKAYMWTRGGRKALVG